MMVSLYDLFPEGISDEAAFTLVTFITHLASELESRYFGQMHRYMLANEPNHLPECLQDKKE